MTEHHPLFAPSAAHRWLWCTASIDIVAKLPPPAPSAFALEGTAAHEAFRALVESGPQTIGMELSGGLVYDKEMRDALQPAVMRARDLIASAPFGCEEEVQLTVGNHVITGTADLLVFDGTTLRVVDLKYGQGVAVSAEGNPQLRIYALAALETFGWHDIETVEMHILQPRLDSYTSETLDVGSLKAWGKTYVGGAVTDYSSGNVQFHPAEDTCRWCPYAGHCPAMRKQAVDAFEDLEPTALAGMLSEHDLAELLNRLPLLEKIAKTARELAVERLSRGERVPGYKLVPGRTQRRWKDEDEFEIACAAVQIEPREAPKVRSVAAIEKQVAKHVFENRFAHLVNKPEGRPTLAPESDKRPALKVADLDAFEDLN